MRDSEVISTSGHKVLVSDEASIFQEIYDHAFHERVFVLMDENSEKHCFPILEKAIHSAFLLEKICIPSGESTKTPDTARKVWQELLSRGADRSDLLINLGGGVVGDLGGFVAATFKRGIPFVQIPTTLLSMVDASVGGKTGVDLDGVKNVIGAFCMPQTVLVHPAFLQTLDERQLRSGFAEMIKHGLLQEEGAWERIRKVETLNHKEISALIPESIRIKSYWVDQDPKERGSRKVLNLGHTIGHALESYFLQSPGALYHGEAVVLGLLGALHLSEKKSNLSKTVLEDLKKLIKTHFPLTLEIPTAQALLPFLKKDKKNKNEQLLGVLLEAPGRPICDQEFSEADVEDALKFIRSVL